MVSSDSDGDLQDAVRVVPIDDDIDINRLKHLQQNQEWSFYARDENGAKINIHYYISSSGNELAMTSRIC
ncbi:uncharacterized protein EAF01_007122 [Botrytis porri]|uniref:uncharacterized protein n=1 Tax=Botrytis porri TaxID=87229 RepID=UPI0018FFFD81|nr:uncharacterized protein EAF01_007122 [Botrytis porri]KAF7901824.1 hypothetical protein EAF01_007122 [Botrytis porri]